MLSSLSLDLSPAALLGLGFVGLVVLWNVAFSIKGAFKQDLKSVPGPWLARFTSLWRAAKIAKGDAPDLYIRLHEQYGPIVRTAPNVVDISDPKALFTIYSISSKFYKSPFYDMFSPFLDNEVMQSMFSVRDPAQHQALRRPVAQKFSMSSIKSLEPFADECAEIFIRSMKDLEGQIIDVGVWMQWYAFDVIGAITFQRRFGFMEKREDILDMIQGIETALKYGGIVGQIPNYHPYLMGNQYVAKFLTALGLPDPLRTVVSFTQECIDDYDKEQGSKNTERPDFLAWLRNEEKKGKTMSNRDMVNHLSNNLLAGSDTTGISLRAIIYYLVQNPKSYKKLQQEIDEAERTGKLSTYVSYAECLELPYLQAVMKEAMRCHPGVAFPLERIVPAGGADLAGVHLDAGTVVGMNASVIHHDQSIFGGDAASFRPERWTESDTETVKNMDRHLMTFGYGSRTCIGKNISIMEMGKLVPQILREFEIEWASHEPVWRVETYWFSKQHGLKCRFKSRKPLKA